MACSQKRTKDDRKVIIKSHPTGVCNSATESQNLLKVFPTEIWEKILKYVGSEPYCPRDIIDASDAYPLFNEQLRDQTPLCRLEEAIPLLLVWLGRKDILALRLVCTRITKDVDRVLEMVPQLNPPENRRIYKSRCLPPFRISSFDCDYFRNFLPFPLVSMGSFSKLNRLRNFCATVAAENVKCSTTIVGKSLEMTVYSRQQFEDVITLERSADYFKSQKILSHVNITYLDISQSKNLPSIYEVLWKLFTALPAIQTCKISFLTVNPSNWIDDRLQDHINIQPLPIMHNLEQIHIDRCTLPAPVFREIAGRYGSQLKSLSVWPCGQDYDSDGVAKNPVHFSELVFLKMWVQVSARFKLINIQAENVKELEACTLYTGKESLQNIIRCLQSCPKLTTFRLQVNCFEISQSIIAEVEGITFKNVENLYLNDKQNNIPLNVWKGLFPCLKNQYVNGLRKDDKL